MTIWLKQRLAVWMGVSLLGGALLWNSGVLRAQTQIESSPEEVSKQFIEFLTGVRKAQRRYHTDIFYHFEKSGPVSQKSLTELKSGTALLMSNMAEQLEAPHFSARRLTLDEKSARVTVERDETAPPYEIILLRENGAWKVDVVATYAKWNNLEGVPKLEAIYKLTGVILEGLPRTQERTRSACQSNLKQIALGLLQYAEDYDKKITTTRFRPRNLGWMLYGPM